MNSTRTDAPFCERTSQREPSSRATSAPFRRMTCRAGRLISSPVSADSDSHVSGPGSMPRSGPAASPALISVAPERASDLRDGTPVCGSSGCGLFGHEDPFGCSLRTSLLSALAAMTGYTMRWTRSVTASGRSWWALRLSERRIDGTESGLWPTADASEGNGGRTARPGCSPTGQSRDGIKVTVNLNAAVTMQFPTPNAHDAERGAECRATKAKRNAGGVNLREACNWPTPRSEDSEQTGAHETPDTLTSAGRWFSPQSRDWKDSGPTQGKRKSPNIGTQVHAGQCRQDQGSMNGKRRGSLNPAWVSQLMGYPDGWLDLPKETLCKLSAIPSSRKSRRKSSERGK